MAQPELTSVTLDQYALVLCATGEGAPLDVALEAASVSARAWPAAEAQISAWIATARTDPGLLPAFDEAMRKAREALARPVSPLDDDAGQWGRWLRAWSSAQDPIGMLDRSGMAMTDLVRLSTTWGDRMRDDRAQAEKFAVEMAGTAPAPEVRVGESPRLAAAKAAVAARKKSEAPAEMDRPARPALFGPMPGEAPSADTAPPAAAPPAVAPPAVAPSAVEPRVIASPLAQPSFMAAPAPSAGSKGFVTRPIPVSIATGEAAAPPLPFDPNARPEEMPSQGPQRQSGLTNDVDVSAIVRKVLAFGPSGPTAPPNVKVAAPPNMPVAAPPNMPVAAPPNMPVAAPPNTPVAAPPNTPVAPPANVPIKGAPIGETTNVDVGALARQVMAFGPQKKPDTPPVAAAGPPVGTPFVAAQPVAPPPAATPPVQAAPPIVPTLTIEQYASLCVDIESSPAHAAEILRRYGANEPGKRVLDDGFARIFAEQPARRAAFENAKVAYRAWLSQGGRR